MKMESVEFPEALAMLAEQAGIPLEPERAADGRAQLRRQRLRSFTRWPGPKSSITILQRSPRRSRPGAIWPSGRSSAESSSDFDWGFRRTLGLADQAGAEHRVFDQGFGNGWAWSFAGKRRGALRSISRPGAVSDSRRAGPAVAIGGRVLPELAADPGRKPRQVHQFARDAAVLQEQHAVRPGFGARSAGRKSQRRRHGRLHRFDRRPAVRI